MLCYGMARPTSQCRPLTLCCLKYLDFMKAHMEIHTLDGCFLCRCTLGHSHILRKVCWSLAVDFSVYFS